MPWGAAGRMWWCVKRGRGMVGCLWPCGGAPSLRRPCGATDDGYETDAGIQWGRWVVVWYGVVS